MSIDTPEPLLNHLDELRRRILSFFVSALILSCFSYYYVDPILAWLSRPVGQFVFVAPTEAFFVRLKIAFFVGFALSIPVLIYQIWHFVGRALKIRERSFVLSVLPYAFGLFFFGSLLALFGVVPLAVKFLLGFSSPLLKPMISLNEYLSFVFWLIVGFGLFFQLPLVVVVLARMGIANPRTLSSYRRHIFVGIFLGAAVLTPGPDMVSQLVLAAPSYILFEIALFIAHRLYRGPQ